jgi:hypothetical protein
MADAQTRRQEYEAEKAALDAVNAPLSAYARLDQAFFGNTAGQPAGPVAWLGRNVLYVLPVLAAAGGLLGFVLFEGPHESFRAVNGWLFGQAELKTVQATATTSAATAPYAGPKAAADTELAKQQATSAAAVAHYAEVKAKADACAAIGEAIKNGGDNNNMRSLQYETCGGDPWALKQSGYNTLAPDALVDYPTHGAADLGPCDPSKEMLDHDVPKGPANAPRSGGALPACVMPSNFALMPGAH